MLREITTINKQYFIKMKFKTLIILFSICFITMIQSCSNEQEPTINGGSAESEVIISHMVVKFEGKTYKTDVKIVGDSVTYLNKEYAELYTSKIAPLPELATVITVGEDGVTYVDYLVSQAEVERKYKLMNLKNDSVSLEIAATRSKVIDLAPSDNSVTIISYAELYDDKNFKDTMLKTYAADKGCNYVVDLKSLKFNDKCSSIKVFNTMYPNYRYKINYVPPIGADSNRIDAFELNVFYGHEIRPVLIGHEHKNYGGKKLYCIAPPAGSSEVHLDTNLRSIGWNDKISSIEWTVVLSSNIDKAVDGRVSGVSIHGKC